ncbi:MAG: hypothetical protein LBG96_01895 [Tannerella sp.]|jgi:hypothetical protein|nr:hypothetical protein [Tannerella sp.]
MTDRQEIRAKSAELAIRLLDAALTDAGEGIKRNLMPRSMSTQEAQEYFDSVINLAKQFEAFILDTPGNT